MASRKHTKQKSDKKKSSPEVEKQPIVISYDESGTRIGDDGYAMTHVRTRMHRMFNVFFIWAVVCALLGCLCTVLAYAQGAVYESWELVARGGNQLGGWDLAILLRIEALLCLVTIGVSLLIHFWGFSWFYNGKSEKRVTVVLGVVAGVSVALCIAALMLVGIPDPLSVVNICLALATFVFMSAVKKERPTLKKAEVARTVVKD